LGLHDVMRFMSESGATRDGMKLAQTFLMTTRGVPLVYYGDEIGLPGGNDPDNRRDFPGGWAGDAHNAFSDAGRSAEERDVFDHLRRVIGLRRELESLRRGRLLTLGVDDQVYSFARLTARETTVVVINNAAQERAIGIDTTPIKLAAGARLTD